MTVSKRILVAGSVALALSLSACGGAASSSEVESGGELNLYESLSPEQVKPLIAAFKEYYLEETGKTIEVSDFSKGAGELRSALDLESRGDAVQADVVITDIGELETLSEKYPDLFAEPDSAILDDPEIPDYVAAAAEVTPAIIASLHPYVIVYNTDRVAPEDVPTSWEDLLDERWKGRIGLGDPETTSSAHAALWFLTEYLSNEIGSPFGFEYYAGLGALEPRVSSQSDAVMEYLAAGEIDIAILGYGLALQTATDGRPIAALLPSEGAAALTASIAVVAEGNDREAADLFAKFLLSAEGQAALNEGTQYLPVRSGVSIPTPPFEFDTASNLIVPVDAVWVAENREANVAEFHELIK
jgi:iron(III) transport system substrate-binding protein